ncbi:unnamed protein product [Chrysodeixis includens]|uniref:Palmitoyltransferase n=1 Tax=Chrysodeixis includens TaxID=689277 RepID=A0A9N8KQU8_CHRIL|nr:unnamed protein product [Chrysodeixis includens]
MDRCCSTHQSPRPQRRLHGLQLPLNYQQVIGWFVFIATGSLNFFILIKIQRDTLRTINVVIFIVLYVLHVASHLAASLIDPSEEELRSLEVNNVPEFNRDVHAHVIENGRCHLCNINTSSTKTKHCSICNKCVDEFDHHCKWLNNCIGQRNYVAFIACVTTALLISTITGALCATDLALLLLSPKYLSIEAQNFMNCSSSDNSTLTVCNNSLPIITFLVLFWATASGIGCALLHLCCFHLYLTFLGVSTYEYVVRSDESRPSPYRNCTSVCVFCRCCRNISQNVYTARKNKDKTQVQENPDSGSVVGKLDASQSSSGIQNGETNVVNFINILLNSELGKAKKMFMYDKNKVHPHEENSGS